MAADRIATTVLLVDDQPFVGAALTRLLADQPDVALHCCYAATEAMATAERVNPSVILQDLVLPDGDGLALTRAFRLNPRTASVPVIVLSGNDDAEARNRSMAAGASAYLVKLPSKSVLLACLRQVITFGAPPSPSAAPDTFERPHADSTSADETLDRRALAALRDAAPGESDFLPSLIDAFLQEATDQVAALERGEKASDRKLVSMTAHSLRGTSTTLGAMKLASLCAYIERKAAADAGTPPAVLSEVRREFTRVRDALALERIAQD